MRAKLHSKYCAIFFWTICITITVSALAVAIRLLVNPLKSWGTNDGSNSSDLHTYRIIERKTLSGIPKNLSGITYSQKTNSLFAIINTPPTIVELNLIGNIKRTIDLVGFSDTEGITYMYDDMFSIVQERLSKVTLVEIGINTSQIFEKNCQHLETNIKSRNNHGLEGISWSASSGLFVANEKDPIQVFNFPKNPFSNINQVSSVSYWRAIPFPIAALLVNDISGLHINEEKKRLLVLSEESHSLTELSLDGTILGELILNIDPIGIFYEIYHPEGITMDSDERIYLVGEPNILIIMDKLTMPSL